MRLSIKLAITILLVLQSNLLLAQALPQEAATINESSSLAIEPSVALASDQTNTSWLLLPGESVVQLAALFYPKNNNMQRLFVAETLRLSHKINPHLSATTTSSQQRSIYIPDIKSLSKHSGATKSASLKMNKSEHQLKTKLEEGNDHSDGGVFEISSKVQAIYDDLVKRNLIFKQELEKLNAKLAGLQHVFTALNADLVRVIDLAMSVAEANNKSVKQTQEANLQNKPVADSLVKNHVEKSNKVTVATSSTVKTATPHAKNSKPISWIVIMQIASLLILITLLLGMYVCKLLKNFHPTKAGKAVSIKKDKVVNDEKVQVQPTIIVNSMGATTAGASTTASEFSGSIPGPVSSAHVTEENKEDAELVLEQAKIYVNINRIREAVMLLKTQIQETPKAALRHWLYLLDIYRDSNQKEAFMDDARQLHQSFNIRMLQWKKTSLPIVIASSLEEFPHIMKRLTKLWTTEGHVTENMIETKSYLDELLMDNRNSERSGFSREVFEEIMLLRNMLDTRVKLAA